MGGKGGASDAFNPAMGGQYTGLGSQQEAVAPTPTDAMIPRASGGDPGAPAVGETPNTTSPFGEAPTTDAQSTAPQSGSQTGTGLGDALSSTVPGAMDTSVPGTANYKRSSMKMTGQV